ncbi:MAG: DNA topoisomerase 3 [Opitutales bacterium]|nr:DNA topoisomerase 3 [Opitutales bacterium]
MKKLIIAEKPSVARDIATAIGRTKKADDWFENDEYIISSAVGHLIELFMPEDIDKRLKYWRLEALPIIPEQFQLKPIEKTKSKFSTLKKLMARKDVDEIINACDAGREGELIFTYIYEAAKCKKPFSRLWMQSMTKQGILEALKKPKDSASMQPLQDAARSRSEADWLIGINGTRAITTRMYGSRRGQVATVGRVQTPTLSMVVEREREIRNFVSQTYWKLIGQFSITDGTYQGIYQRPDFKKGGDSDEKVDRIFEKEEAERILAEIKAADKASVEDSTKRARKASPPLYDLTSLQREANNRFSYSARRTLQIAQALYEKHKLITYPRTDSRCLPEDYVPVCKRVLGLMHGDLSTHAEKALKEGYVVLNKRIFNNAKISDHFAIIPTETSADNKKLTEEEAKIYDMIARRFIAAFYPAAEFDVTTRISTVAGHAFKTEGKVLVTPAWMAVYGKAETGDVLPSLCDEDGKPPMANIDSIEAKEEQTKPPARYTEATLLSAMEGAGKLLEDEELIEIMKEKGLGTPATRAQIIEHLIKENYIERDKRDLLPTAKGENLIDFLLAVHINGLVSPKLTGDWEFRLNQVETGAYSRKEFMAGIVEHATAIVGKAKGYEEKEEDAVESKIISPSDQKPLLETLRSYKSQDGKLLIYKTIGNRKMSEEEITTLLQDGRIGPLDGFRSKAGKPYSAILKLDEESKVRFEFGNSGEAGQGGDETELDTSALNVVGISPLDQSPVYEAPNAYISESYIKGDKSKGLRISRKLLEKTITPDQIAKLLTHKKTDLIEQFRSKRTKKFFSAYLILKSNGGIGFEFPPRAATKKAAPAKAKEETPAENA